KGGNGRVKTCPIGCGHGFGLRLSAHASREKGSRYGASSVSCSGRNLKGCAQSGGFTATDQTQVVLDCGLETGAWWRSSKHCRHSKLPGRSIDHASGAC